MLIELNGGAEVPVYVCPPKRHQPEMPWQKKY